MQNRRHGSRISLTSTTRPWLTEDMTNAKERAYDLLPQILERFLSALEPFSFPLEAGTARHLYALLAARAVRCAYLDGRFHVFLD